MVLYCCVIQDVWCSLTNPPSEETLFATLVQAEGVFGSIDFATGADRIFCWKGMLNALSKSRASKSVLAVVVKVTWNPVILGYMSKLPSISGKSDNADGGKPMLMFPVASPADSERPGHSFILGRTISTILSRNWYILSPFKVTLHPIGLPM